MSASTPIVAARHQPAADEPQHRLGDADTHRRGAQQPQALLVLVAHRPVDHRLGHQRDRHGGNQAGEATRTIAIQRTRYGIR